MRRWANYGQIMAQLWSKYSQKVVKKDKKEAQNVQKSEKKLKILGFDFWGFVGYFGG